MKSFLYMLVGVFFIGCIANGGIHNEELRYRQKQMLKQDIKMKRQMQNARRKATPMNKRVKVKKAKRKYFI